MELDKKNLLGTRTCSRMLFPTNVRHPLHAMLQEKRLLQKYFDEINQDTGKYCFMVDDTLKGLDLGAVETLIVWDNLDINRWGGMPVHGDTFISRSVSSSAPLGFGPCFFMADKLACR